MSNVRYIVYEKQTGRILRTGCCQKKTFYKQIANSDEVVIKGQANDLTQNIIDGKLVDKTPEEIELAILHGIPKGQRPAHITNEQWQNVLDRLEKLETR